LNTNKTATIVRAIAVTEKIRKNVSTANVATSSSPTGNSFQRVTDPMSLLKYFSFDVNLAFMNWKSRAFKLMHPQQAKTLTEKGCKYVTGEYDDGKLFRKRK
jgi:hypothetical protein